jgi:uncharacterized protein
LCYDQLKHNIDMRKGWPMASNIKERQPVALITGAGGGIGTAIVMKITGQGFRVALADINKSNLDHLRQAVGSDHYFYAIDLTDPAAVKEMIADLDANTGRIDLLVNNAGTVIFKPFEQCSVEELCHEINVNYLSALYCIKAVLPLMIKAGKGSIIAVSSLGALLPMSTSPNYTASKAALRGLMLSLNLALREHGIHAGCVCPSAVDTKMLHGEALGGGSVLNFLQEPLTPEAVANAIWLSHIRRKAEICLPGSEGISSKLGNFFPSILPKILPHLEKIGERNRLRFISKKQLTE